MNKKLGVSTLVILKWLVISSLVGITMGCLSAFFLKSLEVVTLIRLKNNWLIYGLPIIGMFFMWLYQRYGDNSAKGNNLIIAAANGSTENIPWKMLPLTLFGTITTHLFGGSVGREGTAVQMGGVVAEYIGKWWHLTNKERQLALICGISAGFSSVFGTPLAGGIFALEVLMVGQVKSYGLGPSMLSAFIANAVTTCFSISHSHYVITEVPKQNLYLIGKIIFCASCFGLVARLFSASIRYLKNCYARLIPNAIYRIGFGAAVVVLLSLIYGTNRYLGLSLPLLTDAFSGEVRPFDFLNKLIFTVLSLGAGFQGGEVTPLFEIGATLGSHLGDILGIPAGFLAALGFIGVFSGATNTPIACFIMGIELFGSEFASYLFISSIVSYLFSGSKGIYQAQKITGGKLPMFLDYHHS